MTTKEFEALYRERFAAIKRYAAQRVGSEMAEDIAQEVFFTAWVKWAELHQHNNKIAWLMKTARYKVWEYKRMVIETQPLQELDRYPLGKAEDTYELVEWETVLEGMMESRECRLFMEYYCLGIPMSKLASREKTDESTLRMRLQRLKNKVKNKI